MYMCINILLIVIIIIIIYYSEGLEFYTKLAESVFRLYKRCNEVCSTRHRDRLAIEKRVSTPNRRTPSPPPSNRGKYKPYYYG